MIFKCKMCGGDLDINQEMRICECQYCGSKQTLPKLESEKRNNMFDRAGHFRRNNEYDKAMSLYEQILNEETEDAEVYWSLVLCRYGIEYVEDPETHRRMPTVNRAQFDSILSDADYLSALKYADEQQRVIYEEEAKEIDRIQKGILAISNKEEPFDVFICYKESDASGRRTPDSVLANDLYHQLTQEGFKVFFARITLEDKLGSAYEPYIFAALNSAKVMVVLGTKPEYFNAVWVKNEWSRYLSMIKGGANKVLIPAYKDMDPYDLPEAFSHLQAQDMGKLGFMQDLIRGIKKLTDKEKKPETRQADAPSAGSGAQALVERAYLFMEDGDFARADALCEQALNQDPKNARAYVAKLMIKRKNSRQEQLSEGTEELTENNYFQKALRFADDGLKQELERCNQMIMDRNKDNTYADILESVKKSGVQGGIKETIATLEKAISRYKGLLGWKDSEAQIEQCKSKIETLRGQLYQETADLIAQHPEEKTDFEKLLQIMETAIDNYQTLGNFEDSKSLLKDCQQKREQYQAQREQYWAQIDQEKRNRLKRRRVALGLAVCAVLAVILVIIRINIAIQNKRAYESAYESMITLVEEEEYSAAFAEMEAIGKKQEALEYLYEKAEEYEESGDDDKAGVIYSLLGDYEDDEERRQEMIYQAAQIKMNDKDYEGALEQFNTIHDYQDSAEQITECVYQIAMGKMNTGDYEEAQEQFEKISDYQDSAEQIKECIYQIAMGKMNTGDYEGAMEQFEEISDYKDSAEQIAMGRMNIGDYEGALEQFEKISDYQDSAEQINECIYQIAMGKMNNGDFEGVLEQLEKISDYKDSAAYIDFLNCAEIDGTTLVSVGAFSVPSRVVIPCGIERIGREAFYQCRNLTSVEIPNSVTEIGDYAFSDCSSLTSVNIPDSVTEIGDNAFSGCWSLTSVNIPDSVTGIGDYAFWECYSLTSVNIPDSVIKIGDLAFCRSGLTSIEIPNSVTEIGSRAFSGCSNLTSVNIPNSVRTIGDNAFDGTPLEGVY